MRPSVHAFLRVALKFTNGVLFLVGLATALVAGYVLLEFTRARRDGAADAFSPPPAPPRPDRGLPPAPPTSGIARVLATEPWFLWAFACAGGYVAFAAAVGWTGAGFAKNRKCGVRAHFVLLSVAVIGQTVLALVLFSAPDLVAMPPRDITGEERRVRGFVRRNAGFVKTLVAALSALQVFDLALALLLARADAPHADPSEDDPDAHFERHYGIVEGSRSGSAVRAGGSETLAPLLAEFADAENGEEVSETETESETASWARRMRSKYNLDTSRLTYDPERAGDVRGHGNTKESRKREKCVIM